MRKFGNRIFESDAKTFNRDLWLIIVGISIYQFGNYMMIGQLSNYMRSFGMTESLLGTISAIGSLAGILALLGGIIGKRIGLKWMVILNHCVALPYPLLIAFCHTPAAFTTALIFSRMPYMFNFGIMVYFYSYRCDVDKVKAMLTMSAITHIVGILAPTVGGVLIERIGMSFVLCLTALCYTVCTVLCCFLTKEHIVGDEAESASAAAITAKTAKASLLRDFIKDRNNIPLLLLLVLCACRFICDTSGPLDGMNMITLFYEDVGMDVMQRGYAATLLTLGTVVFLMLSSRLTKKRTSFVILAFATLNLLADLSFLTGCAWLIMVFAVFRGARTSYSALTQNTMSSKLPVKYQTTLMSVFAALYNVMQFVGTKLGGNLYNLGAIVPFMTEVAITAVWLGLLFLYEKKYGRL